jgi:hypothetical protein
MQSDQLRRRELIALSAAWRGVASRDLLLSGEVKGIQCVIWSWVPPDVKATLAANFARQDLGDAPVLKFERYESSQKNCRIKLAYDGLNTSETARVGMHGANVAVPCGGEGDEAEVDEIPGNSYKIFLRRPEALERIGHSKSH